MWSLHCCRTIQLTTEVTQFDPSQAFVASYLLYRRPGPHSLVSITQGRVGRKLLSRAGLYSLVSIARGCIGRKLLSRTDPAAWVYCTLRCPGPRRIS